MADNRPDSAMEYLQADHRRLDGLMGECQAKAQAGDMAGAGALFETFRNGLVRHIKIEEGLLFPEFERATGLAKAGGPTGVMRHEHEENPAAAGAAARALRLGRAVAGRFRVAAIHAGGTFARA